MDENTRMVATRGVEVLKDILLVGVGAFATYMAQKALFNKQHRIEMEKKEEEVIVDAIKFSSFSTDQILRFQVERDFKELAKILNEGYFANLKMISFHLRRLGDRNIWEKFQKTIDLSYKFSDLLQKLELNIQTVDIKQLKEVKKDWQIAEKEFADYCVEYLKIRK
jgi:hypothetical protein